MSSSKTTVNTAQKSPTNSRVLRNRTGPTSSNATVTNSTSLDDVMSTLRSFRDDYMSSNKAQSAAQASQFKELKNDLKQLSCLVADLKAENSALRIEVDLLKNKVESLESGSTSVTAETTVTQVLQETFERERCSFNVIAYGVPESKSSSGSQRAEEDKVSLQELLGANTNVPLSGCKYVRLGKAKSDNVRPLKVIFGSKDNAANLVTTFNEAKRQGVPFPRGFRIIKDKTLLQRRQLRSCHLELDHRTSNGESGLSVKYVNGVPKVISGSKNWEPPQRQPGPKSNNQSTP